MTRKEASALRTVAAVMHASAAELPAKSNVRKELAAAAGRLQLRADPEAPPPLEGLIVQLEQAYREGDVA